MNNKSIISASDDVVLKLKILAEEKESVRKKLAVTAEQLKRSRETLEQKVLERTKTLAYDKVRDVAILESIGDGLVVVDKMGKILMVNNAFENLVGWKRKEVLGKLLVEVVPREDESRNTVPFKERILTKVLSTSTTSSTSAITDWHYIRKDKTRFPAASVITPFILEGKIIGAVEVFRDITREKEIDKAKSDFVSMASHQLLTPIALIRGYLSMLLTGKYGRVDPIASSYLSESLKGAQRMSKLVKDLLTTSSIESGHIKIEKQVFDLTVVLLEVLKDFRPKAEQKHLKFIVNVMRESSSVLADIHYTREVLANIIDNAIKYTKKGSITLSVKKSTNGFISISIKDTGIGINRNDIPHVFDRFYMSKNWLTRQSESNGLGLYISKLLVEKMGGTIHVESREAVGSTFTFTLRQALREQRI